MYSTFYMVCLGLKNHICVLLMSFLIFGCTSVQRPSSIPTPPTPQNTWDRYKPTTLTELKTTLFHFPEKHVGMTINAEATSKPFRVKAVYLADLRQMFLSEENSLESGGVQHSRLAMTSHSCLSRSCWSRQRESSIGCQFRAS